MRLPRKQWALWFITAVPTAGGEIIYSEPWQLGNRFFWTRAGAAMFRANLFPLNQTGGDRIVIDRRK